MRQFINPPTLPQPGGSYSQVVSAGPLVFLAGMTPRDANRQLPGDDIGAQTRQDLENMRNALESAGAGLEDVCSVTAFLSDSARDFAGYDAVYREFFPENPPVRATVEAGLGDILVEIQAMAYVDGR